MPSPKREALLVDRIALLNLDPYIDSLRSSELCPAPDLADEYEWLKGQGFLFDPGLQPSSALLQMADYRHALEAATRNVNESAEMLSDVTLFVEKLDGTTEVLNREVRPWSLDKFGKFIRLRYEMSAYWSRCACIELRETKGFEAFSLMPLYDSFPGANTALKKSEVMCLVLRRLPIPDMQTSWADILEFRNDPDNRGLLAGLHSWVNEVARGTLTVNEIETKLEYLLYEYEKAMELRKMQYEYSVAEVSITIVSEIAENLVRLKWGGIAKSLFSLRRRKCRLLEAETTAPGREISYIVRANKGFGYASK